MDRGADRDQLERERVAADAEFERDKADKAAKVREARGRAGDRPGPVVDRESARALLQWLRQGRVVRPGQAQAAPRRFRGLQIDIF